MKKYILIISCILFSVFTCTYAQQHTLENKDILAVFNLENGSLIRFENKKTNWEIIPEEKSGRSFEMFFNLKDKGNELIDGRHQSRPEVKMTSNSITFTWNSIKSDKIGRNIDVCFTGMVTLTNEGLVYNGEINNRSEYMIEQLSWPLTGEIAVPEKNDRLFFQHMNYTKLDKRELYPNVGGTYTGWSNLPEAAFTLIHNEKQGLYISSKDINLDEYIRCVYEILPKDTYGAYCGSALSKTGNGERDHMRLQLKASRSIYLPEKTNRTLVPVVMNPYIGAWHAGVDIYKEWRKTWYVAPHRPDWVKEVNAWQQLQINSSEDILNFKYKDLVEYAKECKKYGVNAIQLTGWNIGGQDKNIPSHDTDPRLGTKEDLKNAISECSKIGIKILLFTKFTWIDRTNDLYEKEYKNYVAKDLFGDPCLHPGYNYNTYTQLYGINTHRFAVLCLTDEKCRKAICEEFQKCLDLGAPGMVYDENQHHAGHMLCFDPNHGHKIPGFLYQGADLLGRDFMEMIKKQNPDFLMTGEGCYDLQSKYYSTYTRADINHTAVLRYIDPDIPIACAVLGHNDRNTINMCLMDRYSISYEPRYFKGHLGEFPRLMAYGQQVDELRRKYSDFLWDGEFKDVLGASVKGNDIVYSVFIRKTDGKKAVVIVNRNENQPSEATVRINNSDKQMLVVTPENPETTHFNGRITLQPQSAAVIMEQVRE
ncbi:hypothetical protein FACS1894203_2180 [Bacteroidia bacterium]|nr:hypothetical protein FACS1894203_2180 [Bacteroidia bacterium]